MDKNGAYVLNLTLTTKWLKWCKEIILETKKLETKKLF